MIQPVWFSDHDRSAYAAQPTGRPQTRTEPCIDCGANIPVEHGRFIRHPARVRRGNEIVTINRDCPGSGAAP